MKRVKSIWKMHFVLLMTIAMLVSFSVNAHATEKLPYEYTFKVEEGTLFNGIAPIKQMEITLYEDIEIWDDSPNASDIKITQNGEDKTAIFNEIKTETVNGTNRIIVTFKDLETIDYTETDKFEYELVITGQSGKEYIFPFNIYDLLPGFQSTFTQTAEKLNNNILKNNAPRDVLVHIPTQYMTQIETIHKYEGVISSGPALTNIDVLADEAAKRLKVEFNNISQYSRDLTPHSDLKSNGFTMGQAGIDEITQGTLVSTSEFNLRAYSAYGRLLEERNFKLRVVDPVKNYKVGNYLPKPNKNFGTTVTLYDLMNDSKLLEAVVNSIADLDTLGVTYALASSTPGPGEDTGTIIKGFAESASYNEGNWAAGETVVLGTMTVVTSNDTDISNIKNWTEKAEDKIFEFENVNGDKVDVKAEWFNEAPTTLKIEVLNPPADNHPIVGSVVLEGEDDDGQKYEVTIPITITN